MNKRPLLSFIVPFFNVEEYIAECLESLYSQKIFESDFEVICVDDCSPDQSSEIVTQFQKTHSNLILIKHDKNKCLGGARNTGLNHANGKYVWFIDSDDYINENSLSILLDICEENKLDVLMFNLNYVTLQKKFLYKNKTFTNKGVESGVEFIKKVFGNNYVYYLGYVVRQIYRTEYLRCNKIYFPENVFWEDTVFTPKALISAKRVLSISQSYYNYRQNPNSVSGVYDKELRADLIYQFAFNAGSDLLNFSKEIEEKDKEISTMLFHRSIWYINSFVFRLLRTSFKEKRNFYLLLEENRLFVRNLRPYMNRLNKLLCHSVSLGLVLSIIISPVYLLKLKFKNLFK